MSAQWSVSEPPGPLGPSCPSGWGAAYAMSKSALVRWTESCAAELKGEGITVNAVMPTTIDHPVNRAQMPKADPKLWPSPEEVANVILFLSSREASGVNGAAIPIAART